VEAASVSVRADVAIDLPALADGFAEQSSVHSDVVQLTAIDAETAALAVRVRGDVASFRTGLATDETVEAATRLDDGDEPALFRIAVPTASVHYDAWVRRGAVLESASASADGWTMTLWFADRTALGDFYTDCRERGLSVDIRHLSQTGPAAGPITAAQRELLTTAHEQGYFAVPREAELQTVADRLCISTQAASERLRRGLGSLVEDALPV
jgi:predicted DNA binding protein